MPSNATASTIAARPAPAATPQGEPCRDADCPCGGTTRPQVAEDRQLDDALKETFPASDPISP